MITIEGFEQARTTLSRQTMAEFSSVSALLKQKLTAMFGTEDPELAVKQIIDHVCRKGDKALIELTQKIDGIRLTSLEVSREQRTAAYQEVDDELISALKFAAGRIRSFHIQN